MPTYCGINGIVRKLKEWPIGIGGVVKQQKEVWASEGGVKRKIFSSGTPAGSLPVGSKLYIEESGVKATFIVVHQGKPSAIYDESCNGTWILREKTKTSMELSSGHMSLGLSKVMSYLNNEYANSLSSEINNAIKISKIPYSLNLPNNQWEVRSGENGMACKCFILCPYELGITKSDKAYLLEDGAKLNYFLAGNGQAALNKRIAKSDYYNGGVTYWTRSAATYFNSTAYFCVLDFGGIYDYDVYSTYDVRPAFILPSSFPIDNYLS